MEAFFRTHSYLIEHTNAPVRRQLMDEINWDDRMIGIKGTRGVGKTTFLLQYAKEHFDIDKREEDMIVKHMWPLTIRPPKYAESYVIVCIDKYAAMLEIGVHLGRKMKTKAQSIKRTAR